MGAKSQAREFSLKLSKTLQMLIFWNFSPNFCIQERDSAGQGIVLQSWQHCSTADPACSVQLLFHGSTCTGMLGGSPWLTPQSTALRIVSHCFVLGKEMQKMDHWYSWWSNFPALATPLGAGLGTSTGKLCLWEEPGELQSSLLVWYRGEWEQGCTVFPSIPQLHQPLAVNSGNFQAQTPSLCPQPSLGISVSWSSASKLKMHGEREI